jgi:AcrR family transcriptional regulator
MDAPNTALKITNAARKLLDKDGAEGVTMRAVAKAVGITPMAIYRHFPDRAALLNSLADEGFQELAAWLAEQRLTGNVEQRLYKMGDLYLEHALKHPKLFELMFLKPREGARQYPRDFKAGKSPTGNLMAETVQAAIDSGFFKQDDVWEITFEMGALSHGLIMLYLGGRLSTTAADFRALYRRSFRRYIHGIRS